MIIIPEIPYNLIDINDWWKVGFGNTRGQLHFLQNQRLVYGFEIHFMFSWSIIAPKGGIFYFVVRKVGLCFRDPLLHQRSVHFLLLSPEIGLCFRAFLNQRSVYFFLLPLRSVHFLLLHLKSVNFFLFYSRSVYFFRWY